MTQRILTLSALAAATAVLSLPVAAQDADTADAAEEAAKAENKGEAELSELLDGYEAGEPVRCLNQTQQNRVRVIDDTALVFRSRGTIFVNRTTAPRYLDDFDIPVFKKFTSNLCRSDQIEMRDRGGHFAGPIFQLTEFVPYKKVETES